MLSFPFLCVLIFIGLVLVAYQLYKKLTGTGLAAQQQSHNETNLSHRSTTRQLITQSLIQTWRMGESTSTSVNTHTDEEIVALRNQRLDLMRKCLKYKIIGEGDEGDTSCTVENDNVERGEYDSLECSICLDAYNNGEKRATPLSGGCFHAFHDECITLWLLQHDHCPVCRTKMLDVPTQ